MAQINEELKIDQKQAQQLVFLENTESTNKLLFYDMRNGNNIAKMFRLFMFLFHVAGHTEFDVDQVFLITVRTFNSSGIFNINELVTTMSQPD